MPSSGTDDEYHSKVPNKKRKRRKKDEIVPKAKIDRKIRCVLCDKSGTSPLVKVKWKLQGSPKTVQKCVK